MKIFNKQVFFNTIFYWIPIAIVIIGLCIGQYAVMQLIERLGAYDPQTQMAEDAANSLITGATYREVLPAGNANISTTLSPFMIIYDTKGTALASSANLNGKVPQMPSGVLDYTKENGIDKVTWQLSDGTREALVIKRFSGVNNGYVAVARSLDTEEARVGRIALDILYGTIILLLASFLSSYALFWWRENRT